MFVCFLLLLLIILCRGPSCRLPLFVWIHQPNLLNISLFLLFIEEKKSSVPFKHIFISILPHFLFFPAHVQVVLIFSLSISISERLLSIAHKTQFGNLIILLFFNHKFIYLFCAKSEKNKKIFSFLFYFQFVLRLLKY